MQITQADTRGEKWKEKKGGDKEGSATTDKTSITKANKWGRKAATAAVDQTPNQPTQSPKNKNPNSFQLSGLGTLLHAKMFGSTLVLNVALRSH